MMNILLSRLSVIFVLSLLVAVPDSILGSQPIGALPPRPMALDSLRIRAQTELDNANSENLDLLAPRSFKRARDSYDEAVRLMDGNREPDLTRIKLNLCLDALQESRTSAQAARTAFAQELAERQLALEARADSLAVESWRKAESLMRDILQQYERDPNPFNISGMSDAGGIYRAARREALRTRILGDARAAIHEVEQSGGDKIVPTLILRANQAVSRAEANLAQENIPAAEKDAEDARQWAEHAKAAKQFIETVQKGKNPWEAALLPYDDMLTQIAAYLGGKLDYSQGGAACGPQFIELIDVAFDTTDRKIAERDSLIQTLRDSLAAAQNRIAELETDSTAVSDSLHPAFSPDEIARRISRAQEAFKAGEASIVQNPDQTITIRLQDLSFAAGATNLNKVHQRVLDRAAIAINQFPNSKIRVEGHTDNDGGTDLNQRLSESRAQNVAAYLTQKLRLNDGKIEAVGFGEDLPIASNKNSAGRARNRRIDVILTLPQLN